MFQQHFYFNQRLSIFLFFCQKPPIILLSVVIQSLQIQHYFKENGANLLAAPLWGGHTTDTRKKEHHSSLTTRNTLGKFCLFDLNFSLETADFYRYWLKLANNITYIDFSTFKNK